MWDDSSDDSSSYSSPEPSYSAPEPLHPLETAEYECTPLDDLCDDDYDRITRMSRNSCELPRPKGRGFTLYR